jgi:hypothetical protein
MKYVTVLCACLLLCGCAGQKQEVTLSSCRSVDDKLLKQMNNTISSEIAFSRDVLSGNVPSGNPELARTNHTEYLKRLEEINQSDDPVLKGRFVLTVIERHIKGSELSLAMLHPPDRTNVESRLTSLRAQRKQLVAFLKEQQLERTINTESAPRELTQ